MRCNVSNAESISFWSVPWLGEILLWRRFRHLVELYLDTSVMVEEMGRIWWRVDERIGSGDGDSSVGKRSKRRSVIL